MRRLALLIAAFAFAAPPTAAPPFRILYSSDWLGPTQIFAVDPQGHAPVRQVTFDRTFDCIFTRFACGFTHASASPDGRRIAYDEVGYEEVGGSTTHRAAWVARADGTHARRVGRGCCPSWGHDSTRFYYFDGKGWHVVRADGTGDRGVASAPKLRSASVSPNGRWVRAASVAG